MTSIAEHLGISPGLASVPCPRNCAHLAPEHCTDFDQPLQTDAGAAARCAECLGITENHCERTETP